MANNITVTMSLEDRGKSIQKRTQEAQGLNHELEKTTKLASQALRSQPKAAGFAGEITNYGVERGATGRTGASARDFANEAQGLGGLVRLYATYAANVFAVSAAFTALRDAMNTDMMIRGLDQLGAAGGVALGGLAKQFSAVTDGAISLRESMESTAKAISSGLSQQQFLELGKVAKGAAQALGVNMSDAVSRLTRGITKLEPELLDELGIFTKVGKATEDYAKSVGKSVTSLTDFERRQAFANAVLEEGRQKFGEIAMESNPYDQLLASLKDVAQNILSVVNTVVAPIAKLLADNVALIGAAIAAAGLKIVNQALPALGQWQKGLAAAAADAAAKASEIQESFGETWVAKAESRAGIPQLTAELEDAQQKLRQIEKERLDLAKQTSAASTGYKNTSKALSLLKANEALSEQQIASLVKEKTRTENLSTKNAVLQADAVKRRIDLEKQSVNLNKQIAELQSRRESAFRQVGEQAERPDIGEWSRAQISRDAQVRAARLSLISGVAANVEKSGLGSLTKFFEDVDSNAALAGKTFEKLKTKGTGALIGIATSARIAGSALFSFLSGPLQVAIFAFTVLDMVFSKNSKQVSEFTSQLDLNSESLKTASNVLEKYGNTLSIESINARANAFTSVSDSVNTLTKSLEEADKAASWFDKYVVDAFKDLFGFGLADKYRENLANSIFQAIQQIPVGEARSQLESKLKSMVGTTDLSFSGITEAINKLPTDKLVQFGKEAGTAINTYGRSLKDAQAYTQDILTSQKALQESLTAMARSGAKLTDYDKALEGITKSTSALEKSFSNLTSASVVFSDILEGDINLSMLDTAEILDTLKNAKAFKSIEQEAADVQSRIEKLKSGIKGLMPTSSLKSWAEKEVDTLTNKLSQLDKQRIAILKSQVDTLAKASERLADLQIASFKAKLSGIASQGALSRIDKLPFQTEETINKRAELEKSIIRSELQQTIATNSLTVAMYKNELATKELSLSLKEQPIQDAILKARAAGDTDLARELSRALEPIAAQRRPLTQQLKELDSNNIEQILRSNTVPESIKNALSGTKIASSSASQRLADAEITRLQSQIKLQFDRFSQGMSEYTKVQQDALNIELAKPEGERDINLIEGIRAALLDSEKIIAAETARSAIETIRATGVTGQVSSSQIEEARRQLTISTGAIGRKGETAATTSQIASTTASENLISSLKQQNDLKAQSRSLDEQSLSIQEQALSRSLELGVITQQSYDLQMQQIANKRIDLELSSKLAELAKSEADAFKQINEKLNQENLDPKLKQELEDLKSYITAFYDTAEKGALAWANAQKRANVVLTDSERVTQSVNRLGEDLFKGFGDALLDFVTTGEQSFGDMVDSMIRDLIRLELQMAMTNLYRTMLPGGLTSLFGFSKGGVFEFAKGGSFDEGLMKFAQGGSFTNQIVNTPTKFKFAQGTGLMGEAGPEAIMPLQRDNKGNLGVKAQGAQSKVDVVVNNYSGQPAEAKETVDSRGNRRIEVTIGEITAGEFGRSGSAAQKTMAGTYGIKPQLIRR